MKTLRIVALVAAVLLAGAAQLPANPPPDPISIDAHSPSILTCPGPINSADIYGMAGTGGCDGLGPGPIVNVFATSFGLTGRDENDGHSSGEPDPFIGQALYFSGDRASQGVAGTEYRTQVLNLQAAGDRFVTNGVAARSPAQVMAVCSPTTILGPAFPGRSINVLSVNQDRYNEIPTLRPSVLNRNRREDNMDAVEIFLFDMDGDNVHDVPIYFTLDKVSPGAPGLPSDIFFSPPGAPFFGTFSTAAQLGLSNRDNVDAVAVFDVHFDGVANPGEDYVLFSLDRGSPALAAGGFSAADVFVSDFTGTFCLYLPARELGLLRCDNLDAIDVEPEPEVFEEEPVEEPVDPDGPGDPDEPVPVT